MIPSSVLCGLPLLILSYSSQRTLIIKQWRMTLCDVLLYTYNHKIVSFYVHNLGVFVIIIPYPIVQTLYGWLSGESASWKIWRGFKFGGFGGLPLTAKLKNSSVHIILCIWGSCTKPPNLNPTNVLHVVWQFGAQPPN